MNSKLLACYDALDQRAEQKLIRQMRRAMRRTGSQYCVGAVGYRTRYYRYRSEAVKRYRVLKGRGEHPFITSLVFNVTVRLRPPKLEMRQLLAMKMMQPLQLLPRLPEPYVARALISPKTREMLGCRGTRVPLPYAVSL